MCRHPVRQVIGCLSWAAPHPNPQTNPPSPMGLPLLPPTIAYTSKLSLLAPQLQWAPPTTPIPHILLKLRLDLGAAVLQISPPINNVHLSCARRSDQVMAIHSQSHLQLGSGCSTTSVASSFGYLQHHFCQICRKSWGICVFALIVCQNSEVLPQLLDIRC